MKHMKNEEEIAEEEESQNKKSKKGKKDKGKKGINKYMNESQEENETKLDPNKVLFLKEKEKDEIQKKN